MLSLLMVTGFIARLSHKIQVDKMKKVLCHLSCFESAAVSDFRQSDSRIELVTEGKIYSINRTYWCTDASQCWEERCV